MSNSIFDIGFLGPTAPLAVNSLYPMEAITKFHYATHIHGMTHNWIDTGFVDGGNVAGSFHRFSHGHHLFEDGFKVLKNDNLSIREFLHHLGLDFLTKRGIPIPIFPSSFGQLLVDLGFSKSTISELLSINLSKAISGSLATGFSLYDIYKAFFDLIPHTFQAALEHTGYGIIELVLGGYYLNLPLIFAGGVETVSGIMTFYRYIVDPLIPSLGVTSSVYFSAIGHAFLFSSLLGATFSLIYGGTHSKILKDSISSGIAGITSKTVFLAANRFVATTMMAGVSSKLAILIATASGMATGIATFYLLKNLLDYFFPEKKQNKEYFLPDTSKYMTNDSPIVSTFETDSEDIYALNSEFELTFDTEY